MDAKRTCGVTLFADDVFEKNLLEKGTAEDGGGERGAGTLRFETECGKTCDLAKPAKDGRCMSKSGGGRPFPGILFGSVMR